MEQQGDHQKPSREELKRPSREELKRPSREELKRPSREELKRPSREELKRRLRMKIQGARVQRMSKSVQETRLNQMKETAFGSMNTDSKNPISAEQLVNLDASSFGFQPLSTKDKKKEKKKLQKLAKKFGNVSEENYNGAMRRIKVGQYPHQDLRLRDFNIVKLYRVQKARVREEKKAESLDKITEISEQEADQLLRGEASCDGDNDESVSSDLSE